MRKKFKFLVAILCILTILIGSVTVYAEENNTPTSEEIVVEEDKIINQEEQQTTEQEEQNIETGTEEQQKAMILPGEYVERDVPSIQLRDYLIGDTQKTIYNPGGKNLTDVLGVKRQDLLNWLGKHVNDNYYLGTPYVGDDARSPNGDTSYNGYAGMNCTGFVWHALTKSGANSKTPGVSGWVSLIANNGMEYVTYTGSNWNDVSSSVAWDGICEPGDIIWTWDMTAGGLTNGLNWNLSPHHHISIFIGTYFDSIKTGSSPYWQSGLVEDRIWHSSDDNLAGADGVGNVATWMVPKEWTGPYALTVIKMADSKGKAKLLKESSNPTLTNGNSCYSLDGAEYGVYSDSNCKTQVETFKTNAKGESNIVEVDAGSYWIKELKAPKGFFLDKKVYSVKVESGQTATVKVKDIPTMDPVGVLLGKIDKETNQNKPQGSGKLEGALFQVKYYKGLYDTDPSAQGKTAERTWVFRTNENGFCNYDPKYLATGDELYTSVSGKPGLPIGTLTIQEKTPPEGYLLNSQVYVVKITSNNDGSEFVYTYNEPKIPESILKLDVVKKEKGTDRVIPGVVFKHTLPDKSVEQVTTDGKGNASFKGLTKGTHVIEEVSVPEGYTLNPGKVTFSVAQDNKITVLSNTASDVKGKMSFTVKSDGCALLEVEDVLAPYKLILHKQNETGKKLQGAEFTIYSDKTCKNVVSKSVTGENGEAVFNNLIVDRSFYLKETKAPTGYRIPVNVDGTDIVYEIKTMSDPISNIFEFYVNGKKDNSITGTKANREVNLTVINQTGVKMPETGSPFTFGIILLGVGCMAGTLIYRYKNKKRGKKDE